jgi:uncharacterized protein YktA (UPF0223 family)
MGASDYKTWKEYALSDEVSHEEILNVYFNEICNKVFVNRKEAGSVLESLMEFMDIVRIKQNNKGDIKK